MFHYIELTLQVHIRYKPIIIPNPKDSLTIERLPEKSSSNSGRRPFLNGVRVTVCMCTQGNWFAYSYSPMLCAEAEGFDLGRRKKKLVGLSRRGRPSRAGGETDAEASMTVAKRAGPAGLVGLRGRSSSSKPTRADF